ncbi:DUF2625 family protein [Dactylosporangium sucinum]|uniref:DUF2625 domain-containing protein n=1 Tax=Dactylosporangium sucinum TaxID=1424081 RepID=A0A917UD50_9ACTN|nr:DUF2625 family protein [Dactylosporangium sucinum]GGM76975.1 hypothetical protein GCM10007977_093090 [Dactylosporangium sucinum]
MRTADELTAASDSAWPALETELRSNPQLTILPVAVPAGRESLYGLQVTTRSRLGALSLHTGGLLVDGGWLRVLGGGGGSGLPSLAEANDLPGAGEAPPALLVGYDVLGGRFELTGADPALAGRPGAPGDVCYFGPDTLHWESLGAGHGGWLSWIAQGGTTQFYESLRWPGWQEETRALPLTHGITVYPFLWSQEAHEDLAATSRRPAPMAELFTFQAETATRLAAGPSA